MDGGGRSVDALVSLNICIFILLYFILTDCRDINLEEIFVLK